MAAIEAQSRALLHYCSSDWYVPSYIEVCERLAALAPTGMGATKTFLANSGTEANEAALKLAEGAVIFSVESASTAAGATATWTDLPTETHGNYYGGAAVDTARKVQKAGFKMNATMLYGHIETLEVSAIDALRDPFTDLRHHQNRPYALEHRHRHRRCSRVGNPRCRNSTRFPTGVDS